MKAVLFGVIFSLSMVFSNSDMHGVHHENNVKNVNENADISKRILDSMHGPMKEFSNSKNIEVDFLQDMIPHHQGAINSARLYLDHGKNEDIRTIAKNIVSSQEKEIRHFVELLSKIDRSISKDYDIFYDKAKHVMNKMMKDMSSVASSGNVDIDFMRAMIFHHEGAIKSAKNVLTYTKNNDIRGIAENIIQTQEQEINKMKDILKLSM